MAAWQVEWLPLLLALAVVLWPSMRRSRGIEPWTSGLCSGSAVIFLWVHGGWSVAAGWLAFSFAVAGAAWLMPARRRPDAADLLALGGWAAAFALDPGLLELAGGGWLAPAIILMAIRRMVRPLARPGRAASISLADPSREVRGTLSLTGVVAVGDDGLPRSVPIELELRAGESLAVICDSVADGEALAAVIAGRRKPQAGEVAIDGVPLGPGDRLVATIAPGEGFIDGSLNHNLAALTAEDLDEGQLMAVQEACSLAEVVEALDDEALSADGEPLSILHRLLVLAARVLASHYRVLVVVDPMPWVNAVRGELWRAAVVRASVGRTAVWITADRELARRASQRMELRHGALRGPLVGESEKRR